MFLFSTAPASLLRPFHKMYCKFFQYVVKMGRRFRLGFILNFKGFNHETGVIQDAKGTK